MVFIVGGSCVDRDIYVADRSLRIPIHRRSFPASDLFLSPRNKTEFKDLRFLLEHGSLKTRKNIVSCHEVINLDYFSNNNEPCFIGEMTMISTKHADCFSAMLNCQKFGAENLFYGLRHIFIADVKWRFFSKRKQKRPYVKTELLKIHLSSAIEAKFIRKILKDEDCQYSLVLQQRS